MDFNKPELQDRYAAVLSHLRGWMALLAGWLEDANPQHTPVGAKRWSKANQRFERFDGAKWQPLAQQYKINVDQLDGREAGNQAGQIPLNNGQLNQDLNAEKLGGQKAGYYARQAEIQARVAKAGDTMTGPLMLAGNATAPLQAVTKQQLDEASAAPSDGSVTTPKLADQAVTSEKIAQGAIEAGHLVDEAVTPNKIQEEAVQTQHIANGSVTQGKLGPFAVETDKLANQCVTKEKLAGEVMSSKADKGAACCYDSEIWDFGRMWGNSICLVQDLPDPWVVTGLSACWLTNDRLWSIGMRARKLRNQK